MGIIMSQSTHHGPMRFIRSFNYPADEEAETWRNYLPLKVTKLGFEPIYLHSDLDLFHCLHLKIEMKVTFDVGTFEDIRISVRHLAQHPASISNP